MSSKENGQKVSRQQLKEMRLNLQYLRGQRDRYTRMWLDVSDSPEDLRKVQTVDQKIKSLEYEIKQATKSPVWIFVSDFFTGLGTVLRFVFSVTLTNVTKFFVCGVAPLPALVVVELSRLGARKSGRPEPVPFWRREGEWGAIFGTFCALWMLALLGLFIAAVLHA